MKRPLTITVAVTVVFLLELLGSNNSSATAYCSAFSFRNVGGGIAAAATTTRIIAANGPRDDDDDSRQRQWQRLLPHGSSSSSTKQRQSVTALHAVKESSSTFVMEEATTTRRTAVAAATARQDRRSSMRPSSLNTCVDVLDTRGCQDKADCILVVQADATAVIVNSQQQQSEESFSRPKKTEKKQQQQENDSSQEPTCSEASAHQNGGRDDDDDDDDNNNINDSDRIRRQAHAALLLGKSKPKKRQTVKRSSPSSSPKTTSVGERRTGSATRARQQPLATTKLTQALRQKARTAVSTTPPRDNFNNNNDTKKKKNLSNNKDDTSASSMLLKPLAIHTAVDQLLQAQQPKDSQLQQQQQRRGPKILSAAFSSFGRQPSMGVLGERNDIMTTREKEQAAAATTTTSKPLYYPGATILATDQIKIRAATPMDDVPVANLRLSVFSHFTPSQQGQFCARSCQAIASRRMRGASCIIATTTASHQHPQQPFILGSAECSYHEFFGTRLGSRRPQFSLLYITEVAVKPTARRRGIGRLLLQGLDMMARSRSAETLYLHVDVTNTAAIALYERAGYRKVTEEKMSKDDDHDLYWEFTKSLNLHPGATKGRKHFLLYKHLTPEPTWFDEPEECSIYTQNRPSLVSSLGFEIPA